MMLNMEWVNNDIKEEIKIYHGAKENKYTTISNLLDTAKIVLGGKFTATQI